MKLILVTWHTCQHRLRADGVMFTGTPQQDNSDVLWLSQSSPIPKSSTLKGGYATLNSSKCITITKKGGGVYSTHHTWDEKAYLYFVRRSFTWVFYILIGNTRYTKVRRLHTKLTSILKLDAIGLKIWHCALYLTDAHFLVLKLHKYFSHQNKQAAVFVCTYLTRHIKLHLATKSFVKNVEMFVLFQLPPF